MLIESTLEIIYSYFTFSSCITTAIRDQFPKWKSSYVITVVALVGYLIGLVYITPVSLIIFVEFPHSIFHTFLPFLIERIA